MVLPFLTVFSVGPSFLIVSVGISLDIVLRREIILIFLYCSVTLTFVSLQLSLPLVLFRFRRFRVPTILSVLGRIRIFSYLLDTRLFRV